MMVRQDSRREPESHGEDRISLEEAGPKIQAFQNDLTRSSGNRSCCLTESLNLIPSACVQEDRRRGPRPHSENNTPLAEEVPEIYAEQEDLTDHPKAVRAT